MKTLVYQSFRTSDVPGWVTRCMVSEREKAFGHSHLSVVAKGPALPTRNG